MISLKFIASQARSIYQYKNLKIKVLKCCSDISFNSQCLTKKIVPNYANVNVPITSPASCIAQNKIHTIRLKDEIKFVYKKKEKLNKAKYKLLVIIASCFDICCVSNILYSDTSANE